MLNCHEASATPPELDKGSRLDPSLIGAMQDWRRDIHAHPELAFNEHRTAALIAEKLRSFGLDAVREGYAETGVIGTLQGRRGEGAAIALRADMDALPIHELNTCDHKSRYDGVMHACGHDGHTSMLLGAAAYLAQNRDFAGTIHFVFQPAEENEGGGRAMVEAGLFDDYPVKAIYGMHNMPGLSAGEFRIRSGPLMASFDTVDIDIVGIGGHAAAPHFAEDPIPAAADFVSAAQTLVSRNIDPLQAAVLSITQIHAGDAYNIIPESVRLAGGVRALTEVTRQTLEKRLETLAQSIAEAHGCRAELTYERRYPPLINHKAETAQALAAAQSLVGTEKAMDGIDPVMGSEDFAFFLEHCPGAFIFIGNGPGAGGCMLHNPHYDFNDAILPIGAAYWVRLAQTVLSGQEQPS